MLLYRLYAKNDAALNYESFKLNDICYVIENYCTYVFRRQIQHVPQDICIEPKVCDVQHCARIILYR